MAGKQSDPGQYLLDVDEEQSDLERYLTAGVQKQMFSTLFLYIVPEKARS
jgi:hypothetical protein